MLFRVIIIVVLCSLSIFIPISGVKATNLPSSNLNLTFDNKPHTHYDANRRNKASNVNIGIYPHLLNSRFSQYVPQPYPFRPPAPAPYVYPPAPPVNQEQVVKQKIIKKKVQKPLPPRIIVPNIKLPIRRQGQPLAPPPLPPTFPQMAPPAPQTFPQVAPLGPFPQLPPLPESIKVKENKTVIKTKKIVQKIVEPDYPFYIFARASYAFFDTPPQFHVRSNTFTENWSREILEETPSFEAGIGNVFSRFLRAEVFGGIKSKADVQAYNLASPGQRIITDISMIYGYGNIYGTFLRTKLFNLYLGAGGGLTSYKLNRLFNTTTSQIIYNGSEGTQFAFNLAGGAYVKIADSFGLDVMYRYVNIGEIQTSATNNARVYLKNFNYHETVLGLRINF